MGIDVSATEAEVLARDVGWLEVGVAVRAGPVSFERGWIGRVSGVRLAGCEELCAFG